MKTILVVILVSLSFQFLGCAKARYIETSPSAAPAVPSSGSTSTEGKSNSTQASCTQSFEVSKYCLEWFWENKPTAKAQGSVVFKVYRLNAFDQSAVEMDLSAQPELVLWMPGMGHGSTPTKVDRLDVGTYRASNVFFIMPGHWELQFHVKSEGKVVDKVHVPISI